MKKYLFVCLLAFGLQISSRANDFGVAGIGGTYFPIKGEHPSIRMVREKIRIDVFQSLKAKEWDSDYYYDTAVDFVFRNDGEATEVEMAFPEFSEGAGADEPAKDTSFRFFRTSVNGKSVKVSRIVASRKLSSGLSCDALWVKKVVFAKGETKSVRVAYRSEWGNLMGTRSLAGSFASYNFTGGNWKGKVDESELTVYLHANKDEPTLAYFNGKRIPMMENKNAFSYSWKNWEADGTFRFWFNVTEAKSIDGFYTEEY